MLRTSDLDYHLPAHAIATHPATPREAARLLVVRKDDPDFVLHLHIRDLPTLLCAGDVLVLNTSRVVPAFVSGVRADTAGKVEGLYLQQHKPQPRGHNPELLWEMLLQGKRLRAGVRVALRRGDSEIVGTLIEPLANEIGGWIVAIAGPVGMNDLDLLALVGSPPLPPYIRKARARLGEPQINSPADEGPHADATRYQTTFAREAFSTSPQAHRPLGSVAAPTAGLHFSHELLAHLAAKGVVRADTMLHVGTGTFRTVETEFVEQHAMHKEWCCVPKDARAKIEQAMSSNTGRIVCVGTTSARTLESCTKGLDSGTFDTHSIEPWMDTNILITPGYRWRFAQCLLTNFHLPRSTLMAMVAAKLDEGTPGRGVARLQELYQLALREGYRFYSYGDAMLVL